MTTILGGALFLFLARIGEVVHCHRSMAMRVSQDAGSRPATSGAAIEGNLHRAIVVSTSPPRRRQAKNATG